MSNQELPELPAKPHDAQIADSQPTEEDVCFEQALDTWTESMRKAVLLDFRAYKSRTLLLHQHQLSAINDDSSKLIIDLRHSIDTAQKSKELSDAKLIHRSKLVDAVAKFLSAKRKKMDAMVWFMKWRVRIESHKHDKLAWKAAVAHHRNICARKAIYAWKGVTGSTWKKAAEKKIRIEAEKHIQFMALDYETKISDLTKKLNDSLDELQATKEYQIQIQEDMKRSYLRGVTALNMEAMGLFRDPTKASEFNIQDELNQTRVDANLERIQHIPRVRFDKSVVASSANADRSHNTAMSAVSRTNGLVTRHFLRS